MPKDPFEQSFLLLSVSNRDRRVFEGSVKALSAFNAKGPFDVLPGHANLISLIHNGLVIHKNERERQTIAYQKGVLKA